MQLLLERELEPHLGKDAIPDDVLRDLYQKALSVFVHPRLVEVGLLIVYTGARMKDEPRAEALETARALEAYVHVTTCGQRPTPGRRSPPSPPGATARCSSPGPGKRSTSPSPIEVGRAVATLQHPGDTTPLIVNEMGCFLACYVSERPPENVTFEQARDKLRDQVYERWKKAQFLEFAQTAANPHRIEAYPERFAPEPGAVAAAAQTSKRSTNQSCGSATGRRRRTACRGAALRARAMRFSSVSTFFGSGRQHSTGQTAWQASWSWKPTHSVQSLGSMT